MESKSGSRPAWRSAAPATANGLMTAKFWEQADGKNKQAWFVLFPEATQGVPVR